MNYIIEKNIPQPSGKASVKYPWRMMEVGDSFFVTDVAPSAMATAAHHMKKRMGATFTTRKVDGGVRVWRTS